MSVSYRQELKFYSSKHQPLHWKHKHLISQRCVISDFTPQPPVRAPNLLCYFNHQPPLKVGFHLTQLTHPPATTKQVRGRDSSTESLRERHTPHKHCPQHEAPVSSCIFLSWEDLTIKTCSSDKHKSFTQCTCQEGETMTEETFLPCMYSLESEP